MGDELDQAFFDQLLTEVIDVGALDGGEAGEANGGLRAVVEQGEVESGLFRGEAEVFEIVGVGHNFNIPLKKGSVKLV